jgi:cardiolipin synthase
MDELNGAAGIAGAPPPRTRRPEIFLLPNLLSLARILLTPVFVLLMVRHMPWQAFAVFLAAGATDALDGYTARAFHMRSTLGLWLDPLGDKVLLTAAFIVLTIPSVAAPNALPLWLTALCIGRDVAIALGALIIVLARGKRTFPPTLAGKASTICQVFLIYFLLYLNAAGKTPELLAWVYILTALLTAGSFAQYVFIGLKMFRAGRPA